jgi:phosphoketolase
MFFDLASGGCGIQIVHELAKLDEAINLMTDGIPADVAAEISGALAECGKHGLCTSRLQRLTRKETTVVSNC